MSAVSVVIPAYNHARYLPEAIESALAQTLPPHEVIVVDDGSRDDTPAVLERYRSRITIISQQNSGVSAARNHGVERSTGDFLAFLDADDVWLPQKLERQVACFRERPESGLVHCAMQLIDHEGKPGKTVDSGLEGWVGPELIRFRRPVVLGGGSGVMVPRRVFDELGGFDGGLSTSADWDLYFRIAMQYPVAFIPEVLLQYRHHDSNMHRNIQLMERDMFSSYAKNFASPSPELRRIKRLAYGSLHAVLSGSYYSSGNLSQSVRHALWSLMITPEHSLRLIPGRRAAPRKDS